jgi:hypothetical protein
VGRESGGDPAWPGGGSLPPSLLASGEITDALRPAAIGRAAAVVVSQPGTALPTELPEHEALRAGLEPATCRLGVDNRNRSGPQQQVYVAVVGCGRMRGVEPHGPRAALPIDNRAAPARDDRAWQTRQDSNPDLRGWSSPCSRYTTGLRSGRPGSNGPPRSGAPMLFPLSYVREVGRPAGVEPATSGFAGRRSPPLSYRRMRSLRQDSNPHFGHTTGACLPLTLRRHRWSEPNVAQTMSPRRRWRSTRRNAQARHAGEQWENGDRGSARTEALSRTYLARWTRSQPFTLSMRST